MSEEVQRKTFRMRKVVPGDIMMVIHSFDNPTLTKKIHLTDRQPVQVLPLNWALGIFVDDGNYHLYKKGVFTFDNNKELVKAAYDAGAYFDDDLDFEPAAENNAEIIFSMVQSGNRAQLLSAIEKYGKERVLQVVIDKRDSLSMAVVQMCEGIFKTQLIMDNDEVQG